MEIFKLKDVYNEELNHIEALIERTESIIAESPAGSLYIHKHASKYYFELRYKDSGTGADITKSVTKRSRNFKPYVKKYCALALRKTLGKCSHVLRHNPAEYDDELIQNQYRYLESIFGNQTPEEFRSKETILSEWQHREFLSNPVVFDQTVNLVTKKNIRVRSKNEYIAAEILDRLGIPYHYEEALLLKDGSIIYPDFSVFSPKDGKIYYIEIFGMMSDSDYAKRTLRKLDIYSKNGIVPGVTLLCFFEYNDSRFDPVAFENEMIARFL